MKQFTPVIVMFIILVLGGGFFILTNKSTENKPSQSQQQSVQRAVLGDVRLVLGDPKAEATIVEYSDYKCPSCGNFHQTTGKELTAKYVDNSQANFEIRITPIIGPDSANAGRGAYCSNDQGQFEHYHETVMNYMWDTYYSTGDFSYEYSNILTTAKLVEIITSLDIDIDAFAACVDSDKFNPLLDENLLLAADDEIQGTPGFAIGEQSFVGGQPLTVFETLLDIELR